MRDDRPDRRPDNELSQVTEGLLGQLAKGWEYAFLFAFEVSKCSVASSFLIALSSSLHWIIFLHMVAYFVRAVHI